MHFSLERFKFGVSRKTHLFLAALIWLFAGVLLIGRGCFWLKAEGTLPYALLAFVLGVLKSRMFLDRNANKNIARIMKLRGPAFVGAVYSLKTWGLVLGMILIGVTLRMSPFPRTVLGVVYITVGCALTLSSRLSWKAWRNKFTG